MEAQIQNDSMDFIQLIREQRVKVESVARKLKKRNSRYITISILASSVATLLAGLTAAFGPLAGSGPPAWKVTCGAIAGLTAFTGAFTMLHQKLAIPEMLSKCYACAGRLNSLEVALTIFKRDPAELAKEYQDITSNYNEILIEVTR